MDMSEFLTSRSLKLEDCRVPQQRTIADCVRGKFGSELVFEDGDQVSLNQTSLKALIQAYGADSTKWRGIVVETSVGPVPFKDGETEALLVMPVSPPTSDGKLPPPKAKANGNSGINFDDDLGM
jgi:hypothetical protein